MACLIVAAQKGSWAFDHEAHAELREFLKKLAESHGRIDLEG